MPLRTWYCKTAASSPGLAVKPARVALSTLAKASFDGARIVIFVRPPSCPRRAGLPARTPFKTESDAVELSAAASPAVWADAMLARARRESDLKDILIKL